MRINPINQQSQNQSFGIRPQIRWRGEDTVQLKYMFKSIFYELPHDKFPRIESRRLKRVKKVEKLFEEVDTKTPNIMSITFCVDDYYKTYIAEIMTYGHHKGNRSKRHLLEPEIAFIKRICRQAIKMNNAIEKELGKTA